MSLYRISYSSGHNDVDTSSEREIYIVSETESKAIAEWERWASMDSTAYRFVGMIKLTSNVLVK